MPTAKARIEDLQKQAAAKRKQNQGVYAEAAEIIAIRNACHAERKEKKSLALQIPSSPDAKKIHETTETLGKASYFMALLDHFPDLTKKLGEGHGGQMLDDMRTYHENETIAPKELDEDNHVNPDYAVYHNMKKILNANTLGGRMEEIREEAGLLKEKLEGNQPENLPSLLKNAKNLSAEYPVIIPQVNFDSRFLRI